MAFGGIEAGRAFFRIYLETDEAKKQFAKFQREVRFLSSNMKAFGNRMTVLGSALAAPFAIGLRQMTAWVDKLAKASQRHDTTAKEMSGLAKAAALSGARFEDLESVFESMNDKSVMLAEGSGEVADAFKTLGIDAESFINNDSVGRLEMLADALGQVREEALRAGLAEQVMGEAGQRLLPMLNQGGSAVRAAAESGILDDDVVRNAEEFTDSVTNLMAALRHLAIRLANSVAPELTELVTNMAKAINVMARWVQENPKLAASLAKVAASMVAIGLATRAAGGMLDFVADFGGTIKTIEKLTKVLSGNVMKSAISALMGLGGAFAFVAAAIAAFAGGMAASGKIAGVLSKLTGSVALAGTANTGLFQQAPELVQAVSQETIAERQKMKALGGARSIGNYSTGQISGRFASAATLGAMGAERDQTETLLSRIVNNTGELVTMGRQGRNFGTT